MHIFKRRRLGGLNNFVKNVVKLGRSSPYLNRLFLIKIKRWNDLQNDNNEVNEYDELENL